jgi:hypothetical protein
MLSPKIDYCCRRFNKFNKVQLKSIEHKTERYLKPSRQVEVSLPLRIRGSKPIGKELNINPSHIFPTPAKKLERKKESKFESNELNRPLGTLKYLYWCHLSFQHELNFTFVPDCQSSTWLSHLVSFFPVL